MSDLLVIWEIDLKYKKKRREELVNIGTQEAKGQVVEITARISELEGCIADLMSFM